MMAAPAPSGCARIAARTASACSRGTNATSLPSLATYSGSRPSNAQALADVGRHRNRLLDQRDADAGGRRDLVQRGRQAAAGRVAQHMQVGRNREHGRDQPVQRRAVAR